ncbi:MAG: DNA primase small subunit domain-containing protein [Candidatus Hodarchaeota archaeon]
MVIQTLKFLINQFVQYYQQHGTDLTLPPQFEHREFAFFWFSREGALRHTSFVSQKELLQFMVNEGPAHTFYSAAYYDEPDAPQMPLKGWRGADLIFDIDADHYDLPCQQQHDAWWCQDCNHRDHGRRPERCPTCTGNRLQELKWMCEECLGKAKDEAVKIVETFLIPELGLSRSEIMFVFSGHRGYHIHCFTPELHSLGSQERREIVDYISGIGIDLQHYGFTDDSNGLPKGPDPRIPGWESKLAQGLLSLFQAPQQLHQIPGLRANQARILQQNAPTIRKNLSATPARYITPKGIGSKAWQVLTQHVIESLSAIVDEPVTTDIHRLIRLPGSLNGKTGFLVKPLDSASLEGFDPFRNAQVFSGTATVFIHDAPAFTLEGVQYPAMREIKKDLPLSAAMLLLCKGVAELAK